MRVATFAAVFLGLVAVGFASGSPLFGDSMVTTSGLRRIGDLKDDHPLCGACINISVELVNILLNYILNGVIVEGCADLCGKIENPTLSKICDAGCDIVGIEDFIKILERSDIDPIWYCELVHLCPIVDCKGTCLTIDSFRMEPRSAAVGTKINGVANITVYNQTGTGMTRVDMFTPQGGLPIQHDLLDTGKAPGKYSFDIEISTSGNEGDDDFAQPFVPGNYIVELWMCEGECLSKHPHSKLYDRKNATFTLTPNY